MVGADIVDLGLEKADLLEDRQEGKSVCGIRLNGTDEICWNVATWKPLLRRESAGS